MNACCCLIPLWSCCIRLQQVTSARGEDHSHPTSQHQQVVPQALCPPGSPEHSPHHLLHPSKWPSAAWPHGLSRVSPGSRTPMTCAFGEGSPPHSFLFCKMSHSPHRYEDPPWMPEANGVTANCLHFGWATSGTSEDHSVQKRRGRGGEWGQLVQLM